MNPKNLTSSSSSSYYTNKTNKKWMYLPFKTSSSWKSFTDTSLDSFPLSVCAEKTYKDASKKLLTAIFRIRSFPIKNFWQANPSIKQAQTFKNIKTSKTAWRNFKEISKSSKSKCCNFTLRPWHSGAIVSQFKKKAKERRIIRMAKIKSRKR